MSYLDLAKPEDCKQYINDFEISGEPKMTFVLLSNGRKIDFENISDADAILVANLLYDIEVEAERLAAVAAGAIQ